MIHTLWSQTLFPHCFSTFNSSLNGSTRRTTWHRSTCKALHIVASSLPSIHNTGVLCYSWPHETCRRPVAKALTVNSMGRDSSHSINVSLLYTRLYVEHQQVSDASETEFLRMYVHTDRLVNIFTPPPPPPSQSRVKSWDVFAAILRIVYLGLFLRRRHQAC